ncbi:MarR family winged helix-turn-helix transcriptional regulator [Rhizobium sp. NRK18]|uniref:MarR family winged helix-turn-helix transcriptional regulator n=1 Tax=Rhizobium sp. NRK18 TaxID=2964667 RepID=UPI0021C3E2AD|nr:MarR family transcriptional regulator [Rhizobium sp. NRK18]MCQ2004075.1 MarR family transcriptional regulator [Rhizobium sp. NRK18]
MAKLPKPGEGKRGEDGHPGYLLRQAAHVHRNRVEAALSDLDITMPQFVLMTMLEAYPGLYNADLARLALLTPQTVSVTIGNLEKAGAIEKRSHEAHGRIRVLELTAAGRKLLSEAKKRVYAVEADLLDGFDADEEAIIRRWLVKVAAQG